ncbi:PQQ-binding-like beta-propeller repeat protein [Haloarcula marina]|uniref:outer membrane protein assembly factor BamB family protein n=1 Tax=Haloarcula marina TaxID=2961574 RepID=UPI0020B6B174|nr:PQQ-binding-like beta-propeller repeat protein [Halomicroarcula marina]
MSDTSRRALVALVLAVLTVAAAPAGMLGSVAASSHTGNAGNTGAWSSYQADTTNTGNTTTPVQFGGLNFEWGTDSGDGTDIASSPTVVDATVYVGDDDEVRAYSVSDGSETWSATVNGQVYGTPAVHDGTVYAATEDGYVYSLDASDGSQNWEASDPNGAIYGSATVASDGTVYVASNDGFVYAYASDGSLSWSHDLGSAAGRTTPALDEDNDALFVGDRSGALHRLDSGDGNEQWQVDVAGGAINAPAVHDETETVVVTATDGTVAAYDFDGNQQWSDTSTYDGVFSSPAIHKGVAVVGSQSGIVAAHDIDSGGSAVWTETYDTAGTLGIAVSTANDTVFAAGDNGNITVIDADAGEGRFQVEPNGDTVATAPAISGTDMFIGTDDGTVEKFAALRVTSVSAPDTAEQASPFTVDATFENTGSTSASPNWGVVVGDDTSAQDVQQIDIPADSTTTVSFEATHDGSGSTTVRVGRQTETVDVQARSIFSVTSISAPSTTTEDEATTITADIQNSGDASGTYTAELKVNGTLRDTKEITVNAGSTDTVTFEHEFKYVRNNEVTIGSQSTIVTVTEDGTSGGSSGGSSGGGGDAGNVDDDTETETDEPATESETESTEDETETEAPETETTTESVEDDQGDDSSSGSDSDSGTEDSDSSGENDDSDSGGESEPTATVTTKGSGPGFTAVVALLAIVAAALLATRRDE